MIYILVTIPQTVWFRDWGDEGKQLVATGNTRVIEVPDFWYERRKGPSAKEAKAAKVYGHPMPARGSFSALCHAEFVNQVDEWTPPSLGKTVPYRTLYAGPNYGQLVRVNDLSEANVSSGRFNMFDVRRLSTADDKSVEMYVWFEGLFAKSGSARRPSITIAQARLSWCEESSVLNSLTGITSMGAPNWSFADFTTSVVAGLMDTVVPGSLPEGTAMDLKYLGVQSYECTTDTDYVKAQYQNVLRSALRYNDTELVDWSVGARVSEPWALQNIDILTGRARAFIQATDDIPLMSDNMLQNLAEAFTGLAAFAFGGERASRAFDDIARQDAPVNWYRTNARGLTASQERARRRALNRAATQAKWDSSIVGEVSRTVDPLSDAWLQGRYSFSTSVMDLGQGWHYFYDKALQSIGKRSLGYKCHGIDQADILTQCTFHATEKALSGVTRFFEQAYRHGFEPNAYVLWDFVPFSFVVDWFVPVGDSLNAFTRASHFCPEFWKFDPVFDGNSFCYSISYQSDTPKGPVQVYTRWYEASPPEVEAAYFLKPHDVNSNTACVRLIDGIALFH